MVEERTGGGGRAEDEDEVTDARFGLVCFHLQQPSLILMEMRCTTMSDSKYVAKLSH